MGGGRRPGPGPDVFEDLFGNVFGQTGRARPGFGGSAKGSDVRYKLEIDFLDAVNGAQKLVAMADGRELSVNIPAGVEAGQTLRLRGQGESGIIGGESGDAFVEISVRTHAEFVREGKNIRMDLKISLQEAVEGKRITVPTPSGDVALNVKAGANSGNVLRLKGKGVQVKSGAGDLLVRLMVTLPEKTDSELKDFVKKWKQRDKSVRE